MALFRSAGQKSKQSFRNHLAAISIPTRTFAAEKIAQDEKSLSATGSDTELDPSKKYKDGIELYACDNKVIYGPPGITKITIKPTDNVEDFKNEKPVSDLFRVWFGKEMPTINDDKHPKRDLVNFPNLVRLIQPVKVRMGFIPDSWFKFFHSKTGVTGPYVFGAGLATFLLSKELYIIEHELLTGISLVIILGAVIWKYGDKANLYLESSIVTEEQHWLDWQKGMQNSLKEYIDTQKKGIESTKNQAILFDAKRENIHLQREAEYRRRLMVVHDEAKRKLEYQVAMQDAQKAFSQRHQVSWIIDKVMKSITPDLEKSTLSKAISDLKTLSSSKAGII